METYKIKNLNDKNEVFLLDSDENLKEKSYVVYVFDDKEFIAEVLGKTKEKDFDKVEFKRIATEKDIKDNDKNLKENEKIVEFTNKEAKKLKLDIRVFDAYYSLGREELRILFLADDRVDFRDLVKVLAKKYKTRIELKQVGIRDLAKNIGGIGPCGRYLCCNQFLTSFNPVSINMLKNQNLTINPSKINGMCGRLMCCIQYENDIYKEEKKGLPKQGSIYKDKDNEGKVINVNILDHSFEIEDKNKRRTKITLDDKK